MSTDEDGAEGQHPDPGGGGQRTVRHHQELEQDEVGQEKPVPLRNRRHRTAGQADQHRPPSLHGGAAVAGAPRPAGRGGPGAGEPGADTLLQVPGEDAALRPPGARREHGHADLRLDGTEGRCSAWIATSRWTPWSSSWWN